MPIDGHLSSKMMWISSINLKLRYSIPSHHHKNESMILKSNKNMDLHIRLRIRSPSFDTESEPSRSHTTEKHVFSQNGWGFCLYAWGIITKRPKFCWTEISSYQPDPKGSLDRLLYNHRVRSDNHFDTLGLLSSWRTIVLLSLICVTDHP